MPATMKMQVPGTPSRPHHPIGRSRKADDAGCAARAGDGLGGRVILGLLAVVALLPAVGCTAVPAWKQQQLAKPNMVFDDTNAFAFSSRLLPQCEPGTAVNGSSPGGGCTACR